jgi:hypothetical protein
MKKGLKKNKPNIHLKKKKKDKQRREIIETKGLNTLNING